MMTLRHLLMGSISIHPPREGWDSEAKYNYATDEISIHPPREGWDTSLDIKVYRIYHFNPPTP